MARNTTKQAGYPSRIFKDGILDKRNGIGIPSKEAAQAVDYIYPSENRFRKEVRIIMHGRNKDIGSECQVANVCYAIATHDPAIREELRHIVNDQSVPALDSEEEQNARTFLTVRGFRHIVAKAACGADYGKHTQQLAKIVQLLACRSAIVCDAVVHAVA